MVNIISISEVMRYDIYDSTLYAAHVDDIPGYASVYCSSGENRKKVTRWAGSTVLDSIYNILSIKLWWDAILSYSIVVSIQ